MDMYDELYHHQIKGAKWGVRNGPPYPLSPEDHSSAEVKANPSLRKKLASTASKAIGTAKKIHEWRRVHSKNPKRLTDSELKSRIERLKNEEEFRKLSGKKTKAQKIEIKVAAGKAFAESFMKTLGGRVGNIGTTINKKIANKVLSDKSARYTHEKRKREYYKEKEAARRAKDSYKDYKESTKSSEKKERDLENMYSEAQNKSAAQDKEAKSTVKTILDEVGGWGVSELSGGS